MKYILIILSILFSINLNGQILTKRVNELTNDLDSIKKVTKNITSEISRLNESYSDESKSTKLLSNQVNQHINHQSLSTDNLSNQISSLNTGLTFWGIAFSIIGIALAAYISFILSRTLKLLSQSKELKEELTILQNDIESNYDKIYQEITNKDIEYSIKRISQVPQDLNHLFSSIASKHIPNKYYSSFKELTLKWKEKDLEDPLEGLLMLICQHYPEFVVNDQKVFEIVIDKWKDINYGFYDEELSLLTKSYCLRLNEKGFQAEKEHLIKLYSGINDSEEKLELINSDLMTNLDKQTQYDILELLKAQELKNSQTNLAEKYKQEYESIFDKNDKVLFAEGEIEDKTEENATDNK